MNRYLVTADGVPSASFATRAEARAYIKGERESDRATGWPGVEYRIQEMDG